jgi:replication-associated recombination protein RarA
MTTDTVAMMITDHDDIIIDDDPPSTMHHNNSGSDNKPWVEKYRPKNLQTIAHQKEVVATLQNAVETGNLPHLLLYGPPGSGKVTIFVVFIA